MKRGLVIAAAGLGLATLFLGALPAAAAPGQKAGTYATPTTSAVTLAPGFPNATITTDDIALSVAGSAVLTGTTPFGQVYGTSAGRKYLVLHPAIAGPTATVLQFESPTPPSGWSFAVGDVDADAVTLSGTAVDGSPLTGAQFGFQGAFNISGAGDMPVWDEATATLTGNVVDTNGASGWFSPTVPIRSLGLTVTQQSGLPLVQFWMAAITASLSGLAVDPTGAPVPGATVTLTDPAGQAPPGGATTIVSGADGSFEFPGVLPISVGITVTEPGHAPGELVVVDPTDGVFGSSVTARLGASLNEPAPPPAPAELPGTGASSAPLLSAFLLLVAGALLLGARRTAARIGRRG